MEQLMTFSRDDFEIVEREVLYQGVFSLARYHLKHRQFDNTWSKTFKRELLERKSAAAVLPYDPISDQIVLIEQFRVGALKNPDSPWLTEIVAGTYDPDEKPEKVAKRESLEETGCELLDIHPICEYFVSPGGSDEYIHIYCGRIDANKAGGVHGLAEENEDIRSVVLSTDDALAMLKANKIKTSPAIISLLWLELNKEWLKKQWQIK